MTIGIQTPTSPSCATAPDQVRLERHGQQAAGRVETRPLCAPILGEHSAARERIYTALLAEPGRDWSVRDLASCLPEVSVEAVRTTMYLLLGERFMELVSHRRHLTLRLSKHGRHAMTRIVQQWADSGLVALGQQ